MEKMISLRSDTITTPSRDMRKAMHDAEVGDDYYRADTTVHAFEEKAADMLGTEAAILVLSGTMGNLASILAQTRSGESIILSETSHIFLNEGGGMASLAGLQPRAIKGEHGFYTPEQLEAAIFPSSVLHPPTTLACIENTQNAAGGRCLSAEKTKALADKAHARGLKMHIDGARIFNAAVSQNVPVSTLVEPADSITFCLTKGLGCPVGSIVAGSREFVERVRHVRQLVGGGMRQAGVFAAAGIVALDTMVDRLADDHARAQRLARNLAEAGMPLDTGPNDVETNMVFVDFPEGPIDPAKFVLDLKADGVEINPPKGRRIRFVTHYQVDDDDIERASDVVRGVYEASMGGAEGSRAASV